MFLIDHTKPNDIVLIGEILIDQISTEIGIVQSFGGSPANITLNMKRMGFDPILCAAYGTDPQGTLLQHMIDMEDINTRFLHPIDHATSIVHINQTADSPVPIFERDADYQIKMTPALKDTIINSKILHFSFWTLTEEPSKTLIKEAITIAKEHGVAIGFDPNYHPNIHPGFDVADILDIMKDVDIMKPSIDDSHRIFQDDLTPEEYLQKYRDMGISLVVMSLGKDGIIIQYKDDYLRLPSLATEVIDATGAGDAFWSGLYAGLLRGQSLEDTLMIGLLCSAYNLKAIGSITNLPPFEELVEVIKKESVQ